MKKTYKILGLLFSVMILITACEEDERFYDSFDPATGDAVTTVLLSAPNQTISVDPLTESTTFTIAVSVWGKLPTSEITIPLVIDSVSTGLASDAYVVQGSGFSVASGSNNGSISVDLISSKLVIGTIYKIYYSMGTPSVAGVGVNEFAKTGVITFFNPGLLEPWVGSYTIDAVSQTKPSWDEEWTATTALDPAAPLERILINLAGGDIPATIDLDAETVTVAGGGASQTGDLYGYGPNLILNTVYDAGSGTYTATAADIVGTIDDDGTMSFTNWGHWMTGDYTGYVWDAFDPTFSKDDSKEKGTIVPLSKGPQKQ